MGSASSNAGPAILHGGAVQIKPGATTAPRYASIPNPSKPTTPTHLKPTNDQHEPPQTPINPSTEEYDDRNIPVVLYDLNADNISQSTFCCGVPVASDDGNSTQCPWDKKPFTLDAGQAILGHAGLADVVLASDSDNNSTTGSSNSSDSGREAAVGAGVGIPLGLIALASIAWAVWERRARIRLATALPGALALENRVEKGDDDDNHHKSLIRDQYGNSRVSGRHGSNEREEYSISIPELETTTTTTNVVPLEIDSRSNGL
ncbi:MAG: hypothetical protein M1834_002973 [Cirrosporium novae-zelandiae]|nr:MAG: hypothetical protein M1834_002973 [Cirrosporium novae-zelandiae]